MQKATIKQKMLQKHHEKHTIINMKSRCAYRYILISFSIITACALADEIQPTAVASKDKYLVELRTALQLKWPKNHAVKIVCHGHSVPAGYFKTPLVQTFDAYPMLLHKSLTERFPNAVINVTVTAIGGENSVTGEKRFEKDVLSLKPDVITIDYALNDRRIGLPAAKTAWKSMIDKAQAANIKVILLTPTPDQAAKLDDPNDPLNQHADQIRELAKEHSVALCDSLAQFKQFIKDGGKLEDAMSQGNHPNRKGHELVTQALLEWFEK